MIGNFPHDTPADEALRVAQRLLAALPSGPRLVPSPSPFPAATAEAQQPRASTTTTPAEAGTTFPPPACRVCAPFVLTSTIYIAFMEPGCRCRREVSFGGGHIRLYAGPLKTRQERVRNNKLTAAATTIQAALATDEPDRRKEPWTLVCWRSGIVLVRRWRKWTLSRNGELTWTPGWHDPETFVAMEQDLRASVEAAIARTE